MIKYKDQKIIKCKDVKSVPNDSTKLSFGCNKIRALKMCESDLVKDIPLGVELVIDKG